MGRRRSRRYGWGGVRAVAIATGLSPHHHPQGSAELAERGRTPTRPLPARIRRPGGGRQVPHRVRPGLAAALELLVDPVTRGDPQSPLRWTCKSTPSWPRS